MFRIFCRKGSQNWTPFCKQGHTLVGGSSVMPMWSVFRDLPCPPILWNTPTCFVGTFMLQRCKRFDSCLRLEYHHWYLPWKMRLKIFSPTRATRRYQGRAERTWWPESRRKFKRVYREEVKVYCNCLNWPSKQHFCQCRHDVIRLGYLGVGWLSEGARLLNLLWKPVLAACNLPCSRIQVHTTTQSQLCQITKGNAGLLCIKAGFAVCDAASQLAS